VVGADVEVVHEHPVGIDPALEALEPGEGRGSGYPAAEEVLRPGCDQRSASLHVGQVDDVAEVLPPPQCHSPASRARQVDDRLPAAEAHIASNDGTRPVESRFDPEPPRGGMTGDPEDLVLPGRPGGARQRVAEHDSEDCASPALDVPEGRATVSELVARPARQEALPDAGRAVRRCRSEGRRPFRRTVDGRRRDWRAPGQAHRESDTGRQCAPPASCHGARSTPVVAEARASGSSCEQNGHDRSAARAVDRRERMCANASA
jgi:hypothetical protein